jgi:hypothetical protein
MRNLAERWIKKSDACNFPEVARGNPKAENLIERLDKVVWKIYVRKYKDGVVNIKDLIHEFLHVYCPKLSEKKVEDATVVFARAFECYDLKSDLASCNIHSAFQPFYR